MPRSRFLVLTVLATLCAGCCHPYSPDVPPGYTTGTPRRTTEYLKWAFEKEYPLHVANCLSRGLKEREGFNDSDLVLFWSEVKEWAAENLGDVQQIEIEEIEDIEDDRAEMKLVTYRVGNQLVPVRFIRQTTWEVRHQRITVETLQGNPGRLADIARIENGELVIELGGIDDPELYDPENLEKIVLTSAWLVDAIDPAELRKFGLDRRAPARP
ncbi:MAG: hypothetical protein H6807_14360 [Planctomycetes bacterium]|nr:hypothetical protein [Planctomycetota bacterium]